MIDQIQQELLDNATFINIAFDPAQPYDDLPMLPPMGRMETVDVLKQCIQARVALAELAHECARFPHPEMLWSVYPLIEASSNCQLEGSNHSLVALLKLSPGQRPADTAGRRVLAVRESIEMGYRLVRERSLDATMLQEFCGLISNHACPVRREAPMSGDLYGIADTYRPPEGAERIQRLLANWEQFVHVDAGGLDPLVLLAISHYQFAAIRPFPSENGILTRLVDYLLLAEEGLLETPVLDLGGWYHRHQSDYHRLQLAVTREQRWHDWIQFVLQGISVSSQTAANRLRATLRLIEQTDEQVRQQLPAVYTPELVLSLFLHPVVRIQTLVTRGIARRQTASVYLKKLAGIGLLDEETYGKEKLFINRRYQKLLLSEFNVS